MTVQAPNAPARTSADTRFDFLCCLVDAIGWPLGIAFFSTSTLVPLFLSHLHASNFLIGLLPAMVSLGYFAPGLLVVGPICRLKRARGWLFWVAMLERIPLLLIAVLTMLWGGDRPQALLIVFFLLYCLHALFLGLNQPAYWVVVSKTIPTKWRGRLFGYGGLGAGLLGFSIDPITHHFLHGQSGGFPSGFAACFMVGFVILLFSVLPLGIVREPVGHADDEDPHAGHYKQDGLKVWRADPNLRRFLWSQVASALRTAALPFFMLACVRQFHPGSGAVAAYTMISVVAGALGAPLWGAWCDRRGNKEVMLAGQVCGLVAALLAWFWPSPGAYYIIFAAAALSSWGVSLAANNLVMELAPSSRDVPLYTALNNGVPTPFLVLAPIMGGLVADHFGYAPTFAVAAFATLASLALTMGIREPRHPLVES
ncbi:MAG TPA: MFS transporter [Capsulimonadaceae bacterium]|nr:MFS transporter [Capsulimonadaceae bacterium]